MNLINLSQLRQDELNSLILNKLSVATGNLSSIVTGQQIDTGSFNQRYVSIMADQTISGTKSFSNRPLAYGTGFLLTGEFLSPSQTGVLASSGNLQETGRNIQSQINVVSGITGTFTGVFYPLTGNPSGFSQVRVTGSNILSGITNIIGIRGAQIKVDGDFILVSGDVKGTGVSSIGATGNINTGLFTGRILLSGGDNVVVLTGARPTIHTSGNISAYSNFITIGNTIGISSIKTTGYYPSGIVSGDITISGAGTVSTYTGVNRTIVISGVPVGVKSIAATGSFNTGYFTGNIMLSGSGNITIYTGTPISNLIVISGNTGAFSGILTTSQTGNFVPASILERTGIILQNQLDRPTGNICMFESGIQTSTLIQSFQFPIVFNSPPFVFTQLKYLGNTGSGLPIIGISGVTTLGFSGIYNRTFETTGYFLNIIAMSGATITPYDTTSLTGWWSDHPDRPPDNPSNWDDEFGYTGTLPTGNSGKWFWANQGASTAIITGHHLRIRDVGSANDVAALYQPISGTTTTGNPWAITTKLSLNDLTYLTFNKCGLFLSGSGNKLMMWTFRAGNSNSITQTLTWALYDNATTFTSETLTTFLIWERDIYLRVANSGTGLFFQYSRDGNSYITVSSGVSTSYLTEGVMNVGLLTEAANSSPSFGDFSFFRLATGIFL